MSGENRCDYCGKFCSWIGMDRYTPFGGPLDFEPPDEVLMCCKCSQAETHRMVQHGRVSGGEWLPSRASRRAAKRLAWRRAGPKGAAWAQWFSMSKPLPPDYVWWEREK